MNLAAVAGLIWLVLLSPVNCGDLNDSRNLFVYDPNFPHIHKCRDGGEVYAAAYLTTKRHLLMEKLEPLNLNGKLTCERATWMMMRKSANPKADVPGAPVQTLDVLDFAVLHLSAYERLQRKYKRHLRSSTSMSNPAVDKISVALEHVKSDEYTRTHLTSVNAIAPQWKRTLAIMPILLDGMGKGHSFAENRVKYLEVCFWSLYPIIPNIVVSVGTVEEKQILERELNLPFYEIIVLDYVSKGNRTDALPAATVIEAQRRFSTGEWDFDYLYYTESDQILLVRDAKGIFDYLHAHPLHMALPHRLMPYPQALLTKMMKKSLDFDMEPYSFMRMSCCMPQTNCLGDRKTWRHVSDASVKVIKVFNLAVALGNSNFLLQRFRACALASYEDRGACAIR